MLQNASLAPRLPAFQKTQLLKHCMAIGSAEHFKRESNCNVVMAHPGRVMSCQAFFKRGSR